MGQEDPNLNLEEPAASPRGEMFRFLRFYVLANTSVSLLRNFENIFYQYKQGAIDEVVWAGWSWRMRSLFRRRGFCACWQEYRTAFNEEFAAFLESASAPRPG